jgi:polyhydroxybutyrate depolymerase
MKNIVLFSLLVLLFCSGFSQTEKFIEFDGKTREYLEYVPAIYDGSEAVPLMLCLHGLGGTKENFFNIGMNYIADTANFIVLTPEALDDTIFNQPTGTAWNSGAGQGFYSLNADIDDVGFLTQIIEDTKALYNIDDSKIFVMGMSMGGFMTNRLACEMSDYFTAGASVAGTIGNVFTCSPSSSIPMCHFHGTIDDTVEYIDNAYGNDAEELVEYWRTHNQCDMTPIVTNLPDIANDGRTVEHYLYENGTNNSSVEFYKINNGSHDWMYLPVHDISYSFEIWKFFNKHMFASQSVKENGLKSTLNIYPNPANNYLVIEQLEGYGLPNIEITNTSGQVVKIFISKEIDTDSKIDVSFLEEGVYFLKVNNSVKKIVIRK